MPPANKTKRGSSSLLWDLLTFDRLVTGPVIHFIYWAGLGVVALPMRIQAPPELPILVLSQEGLRLRQGRLQH